jgi:MFS family permease
MIQRYPWLVFALALFGFWLSVLIGGYLAKRVRPVRDSERQDLDFVVSSSLTLLALIIGFAFSMAVSRYDMRKDYEEEEANAIGTEYVRADLLPADAAAKVRQLLVQYLDQRMLFYTVRDEQQLNAIGAETTKLQDEMWTAVQNAGKAQPTPVTALAVSGMNDVINRQGYTQAAWWNRIPPGAWILMVALSACCSVLTGYRALDRRSMLFPVLPFMVAIAFALIADIDSPRRGIIRVQPQNMESLHQSLR